MLVIEPILVAIQAALTGDATCLAAFTGGIYSGERYDGGALPTYPYLVHWLVDSVESPLFDESGNAAYDARNYHVCQLQLDVYTNARDAATLSLLVKKAAAPLDWKKLVFADTYTTVAMRPIGFHYMQEDLIQHGVMLYEYSVQEL